MSLQAWANRQLSSTNQDSEPSTKRHMVDTVQSLLEGSLTPAAAAREIAAVSEPLIRREPGNVANGVVRFILYDAVRALGGSEEIDKRLVDLVSSLKEIEFEDEHGNAVKHGASPYWTGLPMFAVTFREYGIEIDADDGMEEDTWLAQAPALLNATKFAAI